MTQRPCCVPDCTDKILRRYTIPTEKLVRDIWIQRIGNPKFVGEDDPKYLKNYVVCGHHFSDMCKDSNDRLLRFSLPTLKCPNFSGPSTEETCFSYPEKPTQFVTPEKVRKALKTVTKWDDGRSTTFQHETDSDLDGNIPGKIYTAKKTLDQAFMQSTNLDFEQIPSTSSGTYKISSTCNVGSLMEHAELLPGIDILPRTPSPCPVLEEKIKNITYTTTP